MKREFAYNAGRILGNIIGLISMSSTSLYERISARRASSAWHLVLRQAPLSTAQMFFILYGGLSINLTDAHSQLGLDVQKFLRDLYQAHRPQHRNEKHLAVDQESTRLEMCELEICRIPEDHRKEVLAFIRDAVPSDEEISALSKVNPFVKSVAAIQAMWMIVQVVVRLQQGMVISLLEVITCVFVVNTLVAFICWWDKPYNVGHSVARRVPPPKF